MAGKLRDAFALRRNLLTEAILAGDEARALELLKEKWREGSISGFILKADAEVLNRITMPVASALNSKLCDMIYSQSIAQYSLAQKAVESGRDDLCMAVFGNYANVPLSYCEYLGEIVLKSALGEETKKEFIKMLCLYARRDGNDLDKFAPLVVKEKFLPAIPIMIANGASPAGILRHAAVEKDRKLCLRLIRDFDADTEYAATIARLWGQGQAAEFIREIVNAEIQPPTIESLAKEVAQLRGEVLRLSRLLADHGRGLDKPMLK